MNLKKSILILALASIIFVGCKEKSNETDVKETAETTEATAPKVKKEIVYQKNEETQKQIVDVDTQKIIPGLYYVSWDTKSSVYRIETRKKYYFVIPYC